MAYVAISKELTASVTAVMNQMNSREAASLPSESALRQRIAKNQDVHDLVYDQLLGDCLDLKERLRPYDSNDEVDLDILDASGETYSLRIGPMKFPCLTFKGYEKRGYYSRTPEAKLPVDKHELFAQYVDIVAQHKECHDRWKKAKSDVEGFLSSCKSLNEALKLWPDIERYVPVQYMDRVMKKVERSSTVKSKAAEALAKMDLSNLQTSTVLARMASAATTKE